MSFKILSIIVPSYNMEAYLPKCLDSLIIDDRELFKKLDIIVVNDGSKDQTREIAHEYERKYTGVIRVIDKPNGHYGSCINAALPIANGFYVKILDADDSISTENLKNLLLLMQYKAIPNNVDLVIMDFLVVTPNGQEEEAKSLCIGSDIYTLDDFPDEIFNGISIHNVSFKTQILRDIGYRQTEGIPYTDLEFVFLPMSKVQKVICFPHPVAKYLLGREGQSMSAECITRDCMKRVSVVMRHINDYKNHENDFEPTSKRYMKGRLLNRLSIVYQSMLETYNDFTPIENLLLSVYPAFYDYVGEFTISRFNFHYVREWRRQKNFKTINFKLYFFIRKIKEKFMKLKW